MARCSWCDTPHAFTEGKLENLEAVIDAVRQFDCPLVELTGGEPLLQAEAISLMRALADTGHTVLLETSGLVSIESVDRRVHIIMDLKCPDSGECENNCWSNLDRLKPSDQIKFVIASKQDFEWMVQVVKLHSLSARFQVLVSGVFMAITAVELAEWILTSNLNLRMQLQLHKYIWSPDARGV